MVQEVVIDLGCGFDLSDEAIDELKYAGYGLTEIESWEVSPAWRAVQVSKRKYVGGQRVRRDHPLLVWVVKAMKAKASGQGAQLRVVEVPDGVDWEVLQLRSGREIIVDRAWCWPGIKRHV